MTECYRRDQSIVPQQAIAMTNSRLVLDCAKPIAERITKNISQNGVEVEDTAFIRSSFSLLLGSSPNDAALSASQEAVNQWRKLPKITAADVRSYLVWSLLNHNDFVTLR